MLIVKNIAINIAVLGEQKMNNSLLAEINNKATSDDKINNIEAQITKIRNSVDHLNSALIRFNGISDKINNLENRASKIEEDLKPIGTISSNISQIIKTLNVLGTKLVEGITFLESSTTSNSKEIKSTIKSNEEKFIKSFTIEIAKKKISPFILLKLLVVITIFLALTNVLTLCFIVFRK
jgi:archaellum component FlaC